MNEVLDAQSLQEAIAADSPCGPALDPSELLALDDYRVFGQQTPLDAPLEEARDGRQGERGRTPKPQGSPEWIEIRDRALEALSRSKDLRVLALAGAAVLRTDGPDRFCRTVCLAGDWVTHYWDTVHPLAVEDSIERQSALSAFNDHAAIVDGLRRATLVSSRQHGRFSLRDIEAAAFSGPFDAAFDEVPLEDLQASRNQVREALSSLSRIESRIRESDSEPALSFDGVVAQLVKLEQVFRGQLARRPEAGVSAEPAAESNADATPAVAGVGPIRSRQDAIRALDAVAAFFRQTEPSSPVPLLIDRAKRLVSKDFLEVLADLAPSGLNEAKTASGVRDE